MILKMRNQYYIFIVLALLNTFVSTISAQELEGEGKVSNMISENTANVISRIVGTGERMKRSDGMLNLEDSAEEISKNEVTGERMKRSDELLSLEDTAEDITKIEATGARVKRSKDIHNLIDELAKEGVDIMLDESSAKGPHRAQRSITRVKRLLDDLDESKRKRSSDKELKNHLPVKKRYAIKEKKNRESAVVDQAEDEAEKRKIKRRAREEMKRLNSKKGKKKRSSKKEKKHVGARCTEQSACNACQTTTEEFTLPTTTESECCETKPKCKPTTTKCKTTTTPCDSCDTCRLKDEDEAND